MKLWIYKMLEIYSKPIFLSKKYRKKIIFQKNIAISKIQFVKTGQENRLQKPAILKLLRIVKLENQIFFPWKKSNTKDDSHKLPFIIKKSKN